MAGCVVTESNLKCPCCPKCFQSLSLEQVYGGITYYLAHRDDLDAYLKQGTKEFTAFILVH